MKLKRRSVSEKERENNRKIIVKQMLSPKNPAAQSHVNKKTSRKQKSFQNFFFFFFSFVVLSRQPNKQFKERLQLTSSIRRTSEEDLGFPAFIFIYKFPDSVLWYHRKHLGCCCNSSNRIGIFFLKQKKVLMLFLKINHVEVMFVSKNWRENVRKRK